MINEEEEAGNCEGVELSPRNPELKFLSLELQCNILR